MHEVRIRLGECTRCGLHRSRNTIVFGEGHEKARVMIVGEAPGREEDMAGRPFVGASGDLLTKMLNAIRIERHETYITSVLKCRPPKNRTPAQDEIAACSPFLCAQIRAICPRFILALGQVAAQVILERKEPMTALRGRFHEREGTRILVTYHPAYLLRFQGDRLLALKREVWKDLQMLQKAHEKPA